jgi:hypothetical protein
MVNILYQTAQSWLQLIQMAYCPLGITAHPQDVGR